MQKTKNPSSFFSAALPTCSKSTRVSITLGLAMTLLFPSQSPADFLDTPVPLPETGSGDQISEQQSETKSQNSPSTEGTITEQEENSAVPPAEAARQPTQAVSSPPKTQDPAFSDQTDEKKKSNPSEKKDPFAHNDQAPVHIAGDHVTGQRQKGELELVGNVEIKQDDAELYSDRAKVYTMKGTTRAERAIAEGNVRFFKAASENSLPIKAVADKVIYEIATRTIELQGKPKLWRGEELIQGQVIRVNLETSAVTIEGAQGVVSPASNP